MLIYGSVVCQTAGSAKIGLKLGFQQSGAISVGAQRIDGVWSPIQKIETSFTPYYETPMEVSLDLALGPKFYARVCGFPGPYVAVKAKGHLELLPEKRLTGSIVGEVGAKIEISEALKLEESFSISTREFQIWPNPNPVNQGPQVSIQFPQNYSKFNAGSNFTFNVSAKDPDGEIRRVEFFRNDTFLEADSTPPYSVTVFNGSDGTFTLTAKGTDNSGETRTSLPVTITVLPAGSAEPVVPSLAPNPVECSFSSLKMKITGQNFQPGAMVKLREPNNLEYSKPGIVIDESTLTFSAVFGIEQSVWTVQVVNPDGNPRSTKPIPTRPPAC